MMLSLGLGVLNAQLISANYTETKKRQAVIKDALTAYLGANKRLPCPDVPNQTGESIDASQISGIEDKTSSGACARNFGVIPYASLGIGRDIALDGWGNFMSYGIPSPSGTCPSGVDWSRSLCFGAGKTSPITFNEGSVTAITASVTNVIAIVVSHGPNGFGAWAQQGTQNVLPTGCEEAQNTASSVSGCTYEQNKFFKGERADVDDVLAALTRDEAINMLAKSGTLKTAEGQVLEELSRYRDIWMYSLLSTACSSSATSPTEQSPKPVDPWGNTYVTTAVSPNYAICSTRGDVLSSPICSSFTKSELNLMLLRNGRLECP